MADKEAQVKLVHGVDHRATQESEGFLTYLYFQTEDGENHKLYLRVSDLRVLAYHTEALSSHLLKNQNKSMKEATQKRLNRVYDVIAEFLE